jgi:hypothetical protein
LRVEGYSELEIWNWKLENRFSGQKSSSSKTKGNVTTIGLDINPQAKNSSAKP